MKEYKFKISGMHCPSCAMLIENEAEDLPPVEKATCHYGRAECAVLADDDFDVNALIKIINKLGYQAEVINGS